MYIINKTKNRIEKISEKKFNELGFTEKAHLQEWLAHNPEALGEELLIIQKEFDGFNDTRERLDLLAIDKMGNLVVIENKLDDSGRDVTWQVLKYASYCSSLSKSQILKIFQEYLNRIGSDKTVEEKLSEFFDGKDVEDIQLNTGLTQRIMMVAGSFRKEVTSTVLWLMNYKLRIQCFRVTPYAMGEQLLLDIEQIIPMREAQEFTISMADKTQEDASTQDEIKERHFIRLEFWKKLLKSINEKSTMFQNIGPSKNNWLGTGFGGFFFYFVISKNFGRIEIYIDRGNKEENKKAFDLLYAQKGKIETVFGATLQWDRLDDKRACRIKYENTEFNMFEKECWEQLNTFLVDGMIRLEKAFKEPLKEVQKKLKSAG